MQAIYTILHYNDHIHPYLPAIVIMQYNPNLKLYSRLYGKY